MSRGDEREYQTVILGALLHDVGKAIQRAQQNPSDKTHGQWGYEWLRSQECFKNDPAVNAAISHHKDDDVVFESNYGLIWYQADNLASSERQEEKGKEKGKWEMFTPLASPFFKVRNPETHLPLDKIPYYAQFYACVYQSDRLFAAGIDILWLFYRNF